MYFSLLGNIGLFNSCVWCMWNRPALAFVLCQGHCPQRTLPLLIGRCLRSGKGSDSPSTLMALPVYSLTPFSQLIPVLHAELFHFELNEQKQRGKPVPLINHDSAHAPSRQASPRTRNKYYLRTDSLWHLLHLLTKLTFYTCSNLEETLDYSNHFPSNTLLFVVDLDVQPQAANVLRFQTPASDASCLEPPQSSAGHRSRTSVQMLCFV